MTDNEHGREGPRITIERSCHGCRWVTAALYANQGDGAPHVSCNHPGADPPRGTRYSWRTPDWCPFLAASAKETTT